MINASIVSAVRGEYGNYHLTEKTRGSRLWISPLMTLFWFYDFPAVVANHALLPEVEDTWSFQEALRAMITARRRITPRRSSTIPL